MEDREKELEMAESLAINNDMRTKVNLDPVHV